MFCQNCGAKNEDAAVFCESCGSKLGDNTGAEPSAPAYDYGAPAPAPRARKPMSLARKLILLAAGLAVVAGIVLYTVGSRLSKPENLVKNYFDSYMAYDWDKTYDYLDIPSGEFTTKDMYIKVLEGLYSEKPEISNMVIKPPSGSDTDGLVTKYTVEYTVKGQTSPATFDVNLVKQKNKNWLFFDRYKVFADGKIMKTDYRVVVPCDAKLYLDGLEADRSYVQNNDGEYADYIFPNIFCGRHEIKLTAPYAKDYETSPVIHELLSDTQKETRIDIEDLEITDAAFTELSKKAEELLKAIYASAVAGKGFETLPSYFTKEIHGAEACEAEYETILKRAKNENGTGLKSIAFSGFTVANENRSLSSMVSYKLKARFKYTYTALQKDWWSGNIVEYTPDAPRDSGSITMNFTYEDGKWVVSSLDVSVSY